MLSSSKSADVHLGLLFENEIIVKYVEINVPVYENNVKIEDSFKIYLDTNNYEIVNYTDGKEYKLLRFPEMPLPCFNYNKMNIVMKDDINECDKNGVYYLAAYLNIGRLNILYSNYELILSKNYIGHYSSGLISVERIEIGHETVDEIDKIVNDVSIDDLFELNFTFLST